MNTVVQQTLRQFMQGWLSGAKAVSVTVAPPWGNAWMIPVGGLGEEEARDQVEWEMQQRLHGDLDGYIYAWNRVDGAAYAVAIRPDLISYWEDLLRDHGIELASFHLSADLIDPEVEAEADLLPLLHMWQQREDQGLDHNDAGEHQLDLSEFDFPDAPSLVHPAAEPDAPNEPSGKDADPKPDDRSRDIIGAFDDLDGSDRSRSRSPLLLIVLVVVLLLLAGSWYYRDSWLPLFDSQEDVAEPQADLDAPAEAVGESTSPADEPSASQEDTPPPSEEPAGPASSAGRTWQLLFEQAARRNVDLVAVVLQGDEFLVESQSSDQAVSAFRNALRAAGEFTPTDQQSRGGSYSLTSLSLLDGEEEELSLTQFDQWAADLNMSPLGRGVYSTDRAALDALFTRMVERNARPWRLSVHHDSGDSYTLMMMP